MRQYVVFRVGSDQPLGVVKATDYWGAVDTARFQWGKGPYFPVWAGEVSEKTYRRALKA